MYTRHFVRLENTQKEYYPEPAFFCLFEISYMSNPPGVSVGSTRAVSVTTNIPPSVAGGVKLRLASIIVTENELMQIRIPDEKLHEPSFLSLNI